MSASDTRDERTPSPPQTQKPKNKKLEIDTTTPKMNKKDKIKMQKLYISTVSPPKHHTKNLFNYSLSIPERRDSFIDQNIQSVNQLSDDDNDDNDDNDNNYKDEISSTSNIDEVSHISLAKSPKTLTKIQLNSIEMMDMSPYKNRTSINLNFSREGNNKNSNTNPKGNKTLKDWQKKGFINLLEYLNIRDTKHTITDASRNFNKQSDKTTINIFNTPSIVKCDDIQSRNNNINDSPSWQMGIKKKLSSPSKSVDDIVKIDGTNNNYLNENGNKLKKYPVKQQDGYNNDDDISTIKSNTIKSPIYKSIIEDTITISSPYINDTTQPTMIKEYKKRQNTLLSPHPSILSEISSGEISNEEFSPLLSTWIRDSVLGFNEKHLQSQTNKNTVNDSLSKSKDSLSKSRDLLSRTKDSLSKSKNDIITDTTISSDDISEDFEDYQYRNELLSEGPTDANSLVLFPPMVHPQDDDEVLDIRKQQDEKCKNGGRWHSRIYDNNSVIKQSIVDETASNLSLVGKDRIDKINATISSPSNIDRKEINKQQPYRSSLDIRSFLPSFVPILLRSLSENLLPNNNSNNKDIIMETPKKSINNNTIQNNQQYGYTYPSRLRILLDSITKNTNLDNEITMLQARRIDDETFRENANRYEEFAGPIQRRDSDSCLIKPITAADFTSSVGITPLKDKERQYNSAHIETVDSITQGIGDDIYDDDSDGDGDNDRDNKPDNINDEIKLQVGEYILDPDTVEELDQVYGYQDTLSSDTRNELYQRLLCIPKSPNTPQYNDTTLKRLRWEDIPSTTEVLFSPLLDSTNDTKNQFHILVWNLYSPTH